MKVVILAGGMGTRLKEETETKPKPMVEIGGRPMLWHIMKIYSHYGFKDFILCLGYKGEIIKDYFLNNELKANDFTLNLKSKHVNVPEKEDWSITFAETGLNTNKGARIKMIEKYVDGDIFLATYGDAVADIDIKKLIEFHKKQKTLATITGVHPHSKWGLVKTNDNNLVEEFIEKPQLYDYVNGGFFVFNKEVFDMMDLKDDLSTFDTDLLCKLVKAGQLSMFKHEGFWHAMDTYKDFQDLNKIHESGKASWILWKK